MDLASFSLMPFLGDLCPPCRATIPELNGYQTKFKDDLVVIGVSDETPDMLKDFMAKTQMDYAVASDTTGKMKQAIHVTGIPHVLIISTDGIVRWQGFPLSGEDPLTEQIVQQVIDADPASLPVINRPAPAAHNDTAVTRRNAARTARLRRAPKFFVPLLRSDEIAIIVDDIPLWPGWIEEDDDQVHDAGRIISLWTDADAPSPQSAHGLELIGEGERGLSAPAVKYALATRRKRSLSMSPASAPARATARSVVQHPADRRGEKRPSQTIMRSRAYAPSERSSAE